jgi:hypothetical protein
MVPSSFHFNNNHKKRRIPMKPVNRASHQGTYVVTFDVESRIQAYKAGGLNVPHQHDPVFGNFHRLLLEKLKGALPDVHIHTISMSRVRLKIWNEVENRIQDMTNQVALSTCQELADSNPKSEGLMLNINRLFNTEGEMIGYGTRPGFKPLDEQFEDLAKKIAGRTVVLIEDGAFTGGTIRYVLSRLKAMGLKVTAVVIGFCCAQAHPPLKELLNGELTVVDSLDNLVDWIPDHDLIPFIPNCGRVLGEQTASGIMPIRTPSGASCAYPYILPFGKMEKWASMPSDGARDLSRFCLETSIEIFSRMGPNITIGELLEACPRVSEPIVIGGHSNFPSFDTEVVEFLKRMLDRVK